MALCACATRPPQPAMVPQVQPSGFGYSETKLGVDRFEVRYVTPDMALPVDEDRRAGALSEQKQRAYDLALWRASQIALSAGFTYLKVEQEHRDADVTVKRTYVPVVAGPYGFYGPGGMLYPGWGYGPGYYYGRPGIAAPFWFYEDPFAYRTRLQVSGRFTASLTIAFAKAASEGALDAKTTSQRLSTQYAGAAY